VGGKIMEPVQIGQQELLATVGELTIVNSKLRDYIQNLEAENVHIHQQLKELQPEDKEEKKEEEK
jgi:hypothetical protein